MLDQMDQMPANLQIEIRNRRRCYNDVSRRFPNDARLIDELTKLEPKVIHTVPQLLGKRWSSIAYHTRVHRDAAWNAPGKPTVIVFCHPGSECDFNRAEESVLSVLEAVTLEIHLEFLPGRIDLAAPGVDKPMFLRHVPEKPFNGASISVKGKVDEAGTLGGWMLLNLPEQRRLPVSCALTCYHVVRSPMGATSTVTDLSGVKLDNAIGHEIIEYPAAFDSLHTVAECDKLLQSEPNDAIRLQSKKVLSSLASGPGIGRVILASGYQTVTDGNTSSKRRRVDWAVIETPTTFTPNKPPALDDISAIHSVHPSYCQNRDSEAREFGWAEAGDWVTKIGPRTGITTAEVNSMDRRVQWVPWKGEWDVNEPEEKNSGEEEPGRTTWEVELFSHDADFVRPGDSGSLVYGRRGEILGVVFAIDSWPGRFNMSFMTPIHVVPEDIERQTEGGYLSLD
jgi:hypothetical protein